MSVNDLFDSDEFEFPEISGREMACERLLFNTTEDILLAMQDAGINQSQLAQKLGKSKSYISQVLDGTRNMTLKTLADISYALNAEARVTILRNGVDVSHQLCPKREWTKTVNMTEVREKSVFVITMPATESPRVQYVIE